MLTGETYNPVRDHSLSRLGAAVQYQVDFTYHDNRSAAALPLCFRVNLRQLNVGDFPQLLLNVLPVQSNIPLTLRQFDKCLELSGRSLYPLTVIKDANDGRFVAVADQQVVMKRWQQARKWIQLNFEGKAIDLLLEQMDQAVGHQHTLRNLLRNNLFYQLFFFPFYEQHRKAQVVQLQHSFSLVPNSHAVAFSCERTIREEGVGFHIQVAGKSIDKRTYSDIVYARASPPDEGKQDCPGSVALDCQFDAGGLLERLEGNINIAQSEEEFTRVAVKLSRNQQAMLGDEDFAPFNIPV